MAKARNFGKLLEYVIAAVLVASVLIIPVIVDIAIIKAVYIAMVILFVGVSTLLSYSKRKEDV